MSSCPTPPPPRLRFSALQRAEIAEIRRRLLLQRAARRFSALQRAEIAEIDCEATVIRARLLVSVLFNEPKLLKYEMLMCSFIRRRCFSALQRAEIAEIDRPRPRRGAAL